MPVTLTPGQGVFLHGFRGARRSLTWADVRDTPTIDFKQLQRANLPLGTIHYLQPDIVEWVKAEKMTLADCLTVSPVWGAHPIRHFGADLGDLVSSRWTADQLVRMGVRYQDLLDVGLTPDNMRLFTHITLSGWCALGLTKEHAGKFTDAQTGRLFSMPRQEVMRALRSE